MGVTCHACWIFAGRFLLIWPFNDYPSLPRLGEYFIAVELTNMISADTFPCRRDTALDLLWCASGFYMFPSTLKGLLESGETMAL